MILTERSNSGGVSNSSVSRTEIPYDALSFSPNSFTLQAKPSTVDEANPESFKKPEESNISLHNKMSSKPSKSQTPCDSPANHAGSSSFTSEVGAFDSLGIDLASYFIKLKFKR